MPNTMTFFYMYPLIQFHDVVEQRQQKNFQKSSCFADLNVVLFCRSRCRRASSSLLELPVKWGDRGTAKRGTREQEYEEGAIFISS